MTNIEVSNLAPGSIPVWTKPLILAVSTAIGLLSALLGDGVWNGLSWLALGYPLVVVAHRYWKSGRVATP